MPWISGIEGQNLEPGAAKPEPAVPTKIKARIAVALNDHGHWEAVGSNHDDDSSCVEDALSILHSRINCNKGIHGAVSTHMVDVEIPLPTASLRQGVLA